MNQLADPAPGRPAGISAEEWQLRQDLAACCQLADVYGMSDMAGTHISARLPGPDHVFLLNPFGAFLEEVTASSLIKVDLEGRVLVGAPHQLNRAGFTIHSAVHMNNLDIVCVMHTHAMACVGVSMQQDGLLPLSQKALLMWDFVRYHDFEGAALNLDERARIVADLGPEGRAMLLRNHGALSVGNSVAEAFCWMYKLEMACRHQIDALSGGHPLNTLSAQTVQHCAAQGRALIGPGGQAETGTLEWPALLRKLERERGTSWRN